MPTEPTSPSDPAPPGPPRSLSRRIFGEIHWTPPLWIGALSALSRGAAQRAAGTGDFLKRNRTRVLGGVLAVLVLVLGGLVVSNLLESWTLGQPKPPRISMNVIRPDPTP